MPGVIMVQPTGGLCNRLAVLTSCAALAERSGRELQVCWAASPGWSDEDLGDLFENAFARVGVAAFAHADSCGLSLHDGVAVTGVGGVDQDWRYHDSPGLTGVFDSVAHPVVMYRGFRPCQDLLAPEDRRRALPGFARDLSAQLRALRPVASLRERIDAIARSFDPRTVGVHVRRGDAIQHPQLAEQYRRSSDAAFLARMDRLVRARSGQTFFLATDSEETGRLFQERYGDGIIVNTAKRFVPSVYGAPKDNQADAVVDLFALARTRMILGSYYSTFSKTAAALGGVPLRIVVGDSPTQRTARMVRLVCNELVRRARSQVERRQAPR